MRQDNIGRFAITGDFLKGASLGDRQNTHLDISVGYDKGGANYFHGGTNPRAYSLSLHAVRIHDGMMSFMVGSGFNVAFVLERVARLNPKRLAALREAFTPHAQTFAALAETNDRAGIRALADQLMAGLPAKPAKKTATQTSAA